jgi:hypothetical protein
MMNDEEHDALQKKIDHENKLLLLQTQEIGPYPLASVPRAVMDRLQLLLSKAHHLDGATTVDERDVYLAFRVPHGFLACDCANLRFWPWGWNGNFGSSLTFLPLNADGTAVGRCSRVAVSSSSPAYPALLKGRFIAIFFAGNKARAAQEVDLRTRGNADRFDDFVQGSRTTSRWQDESAHYHELLRMSTMMSALASPGDILSRSWLAYYERKIVSLEDWERNNVILDTDAASIVDDFPLLADFIRRLQSVDDIYAVAQGFFSFHWNTKDFLRDLWGEIFSWTEGALTPGIGALVARSFDVYMLSGELTRCGRRLPWLDGRRMVVKHIEVDLKAIEKAGALDSYWQRLSFNACMDFRIDWGLVVTGRDVPIDLRSLMRDLASFGLDGDLDAAEAMATSLLEQAVISKRATIPPKAAVQPGFGPFSSLEFFEYYDEVFILARTDEEHFAFASVNPSKNVWRFLTLPAHDGQLDETDTAEWEKILSVPKERVFQILSKEEVNRKHAAIKLLFAACIHDFWVVEQRNCAFETRVVTVPRTREAPQSGRRVIYLPRVTYGRAPAIERTTAYLDLQPRSAQHVRGHLRLCPASSPGQRLLAERYGIEVPNGYTFVRPHHRGASERPIIYRSRSALRALYEKVDSSGTDQRFPDDWRRFEEDVKVAMEREGFDVVHVGRSHPGDDGVDLYATKGSGLEQVTWIIQCKCYSPKRKVGPHHVRELVGSLSAYERGARGMIVTTSGFTAGAEKEARKHNVRLIDGVSLGRLSNAQESNTA